MIDSWFISKIMLIVGVLLCPVLLIIIFTWFLGLAIIQIKRRLLKRQKWRNTPCPGCIYFVDCRELQCAVNPSQVLTQNAVDCLDFQPLVGTRIHDFESPVAKAKDSHIDS